jgi:hypothetical protein
VPVINSGVEVRYNDQGNAVLLLKVKRGSGFLSRFQPPVLEKRVKLDRLGTFVLKQIDGKTSTKQIIEQFIKIYRTNRREAYLSTVSFLKSLAGRGAISILVK